MNKLILLVEDDENDLMFLKMAMKHVGLTNPVEVATNGEEALNYFQGTGKFADRSKFPLPFLVLLDLKLPYVMGLDVLKWIRAQPQFKSTIVIVFTSSRHAQDVRTAYQLGANGYLVKPSDLDALEGIVRALNDFWLIHNIPPPN